MPDRATDQGAGNGDGSIVAPMSGTIVDIRVTTGQAVAEGDVLGTVEDALGDQVAVGARLFEVRRSCDTDAGRE